MIQQIQQFYDERYTNQRRSLFAKDMEIKKKIATPFQSHINCLHFVCFFMFESYPHYRKVCLNKHRKSI